MRDPGIGKLGPLAGKRGQNLIDILALLGELVFHGGKAKREAQAHGFRFLLRVHPAAPRAKPFAAQISRLRFPKLRRAALDGFPVGRDAVFGDLLFEPGAEEGVQNFEVKT